MVDYLVLDHLSNLKRATYQCPGKRSCYYKLLQKLLVMFSDFPQFSVRDFKIQRRGRQRERQKKQTNKQTKTKTKGLISKITTSQVHHTFLYISFAAFARLRREKAQFRALWRT